MVTLPANLPSIRDARLPEVYESAKNALAQCSRIDECAEWANKAEALASYAKQAEDKTLQNTAMRIQARAVRRCGELLKEIAPKKNHHDAAESTRAGGDPSRRQVAEEAGLSDRQRKTALRVANVETMDFEAAVDSESPPTVTALAERGKKPAPKPLIDLEGRDETEFAASTQIQGAMREFVAELNRTTPAAAVRGAFEDERKRMQKHAYEIADWARRLLEELENVDD